MTPEELAKILRRTYEDAQDRGTYLTTATCLFGIRYIDELDGCDTPPASLCELAGILDHGPTINLGKRLSRHVKITSSR